MLDARRQNAYTLALPSGEWRIRLAAYDAMWQFSPESPAITVSILFNPRRLYLPFVIR